MNLRNIDFRIWDKKTKRMWTWHIFCQQGYNLVDLSYLHFGSMIIMQSIELFDKNGIKIYEGDLIKNGTILGEIEYIQSLGAFMWNPIPVNKNKENWEIGLHFIVKNEAYSFEEENYLEADKIEIIGNIFENPELLNKFQND